MHPSARGASITPPLSHSSNSQNDVIIPFFFSPSLSDTSHGTKTFTLAVAGIFSGSPPLQRETEGHSATKEEHFVPLT